MHFLLLTTYYHRSRNVEYFYESYQYGCFLNKVCIEIVTKIKFTICGVASASGKLNKIFLNFKKNLTHYLK